MLELSRSLAFRGGSLTFFGDAAVPNVISFVEINDFLGDIRGMVRNPARGASVNGLTAVVFLFDRDGALITTARAAIDSLAPGAESPFVVTIPHATDVGRYRVSFRTDDRIVPHIDRRDRPMAQANNP